MSPSSSPLTGRLAISSADRGGGGCGHGSCVAASQGVSTTAAHHGPVLMDRSGHSRVSKKATVAHSASKVSMGSYLRSRRRGRSQAGRLGQLAARAAGAPHNKPLLRSMHAAGAHLIT
jgi:hypothetical protein